MRKIPPEGLGRQEPSARDVSQLTTPASEPMCQGFASQGPDAVAQDCMGTRTSKQWHVPSMSDGKTTQQGHREV